MEEGPAQAPAEIPVQEAGSSPEQETDRDLVQAHLSAETSAPAGSSGAETQEWEPDSSPVFSHSRLAVQEADFRPAVTVKSNELLLVLSFQINGREVLWHWEGETLVPEGSVLTPGENEVCLTLLGETGAMYSMETWNFTAENVKNA